jgi:hypothetical protein
VTKMPALIPCRLMILVLGLAAGARVRADDPPDGPLPPYPLPAEASRALDELAARSDVLVVGEMHGTREVPALVAGMLPSLAKQGYGVLAVEVPSDQQAGLIAWAEGKTAAIPPFFSKPGTDGRGNRQMLTLIRTALSDPFRWKLICFDQPEADARRDYEALMKEMGQPGVLGSANPSAESKLSAAELAFTRKGEEQMAADLAAPARPLEPRSRVVAICGNIHARTANHAQLGDLLSSLWPSFAAALQRAHPDWRVRSIDVRPHAGACFTDGNVQPFGGPPLDRAEARPTPDGDWDLELHIPRSTPATFLATPADEP